VSGLNYALYLGPSAQSSNLLLASVTRVPLQGRTASNTVPFGDMALTLVVSPRGVLSGSLPRALPWIIAIGGILLALGAGLVTYRLIDRRQRAEELADQLEQTAGENRRLYAEQHDIAQTLQHALLPSALPRVDGIESSALYKAGERGVEIGGDWYDLIDVGEGKLLLVVGDVSGRGLPAATTMASLRYAIQAYAVQNDPPPVILTKLSRLVSVADGGQLATVLCVLIDVEGRHLTFSNAGHLPPLLLSNGCGDYLESQIGLPIGVEADAIYSSTTVAVPPQATVLAFTDGLVERRGESLDASLARLREMANADGTPLPELLDDLVADLHDQPSEDDSAILGLRWTS
jgi:serine phosphatase RsbU (regulator of sigma subunit)